MELIKELMEQAAAPQESIMENWAKKLAQANRERAKKEAEELKAFEAEQARIRKEQEALKKADLSKKVAQIIQREVSNTFPDADPFDFIFPKVRKLGVPEHRVMDVLNQASKELGAKNYDHYLKQFAADHGGSLD
jgi:predicted O-methyltransferase YrrM